MVNLWPGDLPFDADGEPTDEQRAIAPGPVFKLQEVQNMVSTTNVTPATRRCAMHLHDLAWDGSDIERAIKSLREADYRNSQWCNYGRRLWAPCDAYSISQYREEGREDLLPFGLYVKFAVNPKTGRTIVLISCHTS